MDAQDCAEQIPGSSVDTGSEATLRLLRSAGPIEARPSRRIGYARPQQQPFSSSARNRSSVMALGRIDHLQHYFSRTERLLNRGGSYLKPQSPERKQHGGAIAVMPELDSSHENNTEMAAVEEDLEEAQIAPLPPSPVLNEFAGSVKEDIDPVRRRKELNDLIKQSIRMFILYEMNGPTHPSSSAVSVEASPSDREDNDTFLELLDSLTSCIRSARTYSTSIPTHQSLATSFSVFREDALLILSHLRAIAKRNAIFDDPPVSLYENERHEIKSWLENVAEYLENESSDGSIISDSMNWIRPELWSYSTRLPRPDQSCIEEGNDEPVSDGELQRFQNLLNCYSDTHLPSILDQRDAFLESLRDGLTLCLIYNSIVRRSAKPFGIITRYHLDTTIKYRVTDNLRFWRAALLYRFGLELLPAQFNEQSIWEFEEAGKKQLFRAIIAFCRAVIDETALFMANAEQCVKEVPSTSELEVETLRI